MYRYRSEPAEQATRAYAALAKRYGMSLTELSLRWARERASVTTTLLGHTSMVQVLCRSGEQRSDCVRVALDADAPPPSISAIPVTVGCRPSSAAARGGSPLLYILYIRYIRYIRNSSRRISATSGKRNRSPSSSRGRSIACTCATGYLSSRRRASARIGRGRARLGSRSRD